MTEALSRAFAADIEVRSDGTGRTVAGIVVPFGRTAVVSDGGPRYEEGFQRGAFARTIERRGARVKLLSQHNSRAFPLGKATLLREDEAGLYGEFHVSATRAGDEALELLRDGAVDSFSVGFSPVKHEKRGRVTWRTEVALREASLVTFPAYEDARVSAVRMLEDFTEDELRTLTDRLLENIPDLRERLASDVAPSSTDEPGPPVEADPAVAPQSDTSMPFRYSAALRQRGVRRESTQ